MDEEAQAQIAALKDKATEKRFADLEKRVDEIEQDRARVIGWAIKGFGLVAIYIFKDPLIRLWDAIK